MTEFSPKSLSCCPQGIRCLLLTFFPRTGLLAVRVCMCVYVYASSWVRGCTCVLVWSSASWSMCASCLCVCVCVCVRTTRSVLSQPRASCDAASAVSRALNGNWTRETRNERLRWSSCIGGPESARARQPFLWLRPPLHTDLQYDSSPSCIVKVILFFFYFFFFLYWGQRASMSALSQGLITIFSIRMLHYTP